MPPATLTCYGSGAEPSNTPPFLWLFKVGGRAAANCPTRGLRHKSPLPLQFGTNSSGSARAQSMEASLLGDWQFCLPESLVRALLPFFFFPSLPRRPSWETSLAGLLGPERRDSVFSAQMESLHTKQWPSLTHQSVFQAIQQLTIAGKHEKPVARYSYRLIRNTSLGNVQSVLRASSPMGKWWHHQPPIKCRNEAVSGLRRCK